MPSGETGEGGTTTVDTTAGDDSSGDIDCAEPQASVEAIFDARCTAAGCHDMAAAAGLNLSVDDWTAQLVGRASTQCPDVIRVVPGDPVGSLLQRKIDGTTDCGEPMPVGDPLAAADIACIAAWIEQLPPSACQACGTQPCVDLSSSVEHCGACDSPCPPGIGCAQGQCACPADTLACGDVCADTLVDPANCGDCGTQCDAGTVCNAGTCSDDCGTLTACGGGCVNTETHALHCGACNSPCSSGAQCVGGTCVCEGPVPGYAADIEPIFTASCTSVGCHGSVTPKEGLDLSMGMGYAALVGVASTQCGDRLRVDAANPSGSYLIDKLQGSNLCFGTQMPKNSRLPAAQIDLVSAWICHGAQP